VNRPNVVLFMPDQLRADAVGAFGNPVASTPNVDALAARGTVFTSAYSQHPACAQSRASIFTGWYPHVAGHRTLQHLLQPWEPNLLRLLKDSGYHVAWAGARGDTFAPGVTAECTDFHGFLVRPDGRSLLDHILRPPYPPGSKWFDAFWFGCSGNDGPVLDLDEATVRTAEELLARGMPEPWVLFVALTFPHPPFAVEEPWFSLHDRSAVPRPQAASASEGKPQFMAALRECSRLERLDADDWAEITATYYGMVSRVDHQLGRVVDAVDRAGATDRTAVAFFTDHGEYLGDYGLVEKWPSGLDDCLLRNPLVIDVPGYPGGGRCDALVEMVDLLPTLLDLAATTASHTHFGRSLVPLLEDPSREHRVFVCSEGGFARGEENVIEPPMPGTVYEHKTRLQNDDITLVGRAIALRTAQWTYVNRLYEDDELYDRVGDPHELVNLHGRPEHADVARQLRDQLLEWMVATSDVVRWTRDPRFEPDLMDEILGADTG
jgi:arylsulfatase A-like enzyme